MSSMEMFESIRTQDVKRVRALANRFSRSTSEQERTRALIAAVETGLEELVEVLLEAGIDPNGRVSRDAPGPQLIRIGPADGAKVGQLLAGAARSTSAGAGQLLEFVQTLMEETPGAEPGGADRASSGQARMDPVGPDAPETALMAAIRAGSWRIVALLLGAGACSNPRGLFEEAPLVAAVGAGHLRIVELLLDAGAAIDGGLDEPPLHTAARLRHAKMVKLLLDRGADANLADARGTTALMKVVAAGETALTRILLDGGADVNVVDQGRCAPWIAAEKGDRELFELLAGHAKANVLRRGRRILEERPQEPPTPTPSRPRATRRTRKLPAPGE